MAKTGPKPKPLSERFWPKVDMSIGPDACWPWLGTKLPSGYGTVGLGGRHLGKGYAHRVAWELANRRPVPPGLYVLHRCDNPSCVNPGHLFAGTAKQNVDDMCAKGRAPIGSTKAQAKLTESDVVEICHLRKGGARLKELSAAFGVCESIVSEIANRKRWTHVNIPV